MRLIHLLGTLALATTACGEVVGAGGSGADAAPGPTLTAVSPDHGPLGGGVQITAMGSGFQSDGDAIVVVGGFLATDVQVVDDATVTFTMPAGTTGGDLADVTVSNQNGFATLRDALTYGALATVISVDPVFAKRAGGTTITITGRGFDSEDAGATAITVNGVSATDVTVVDDQTITATVAADTSAEPFAPVDLVVTNGNGNVTLAGSVRYTAPGLLGTERTNSSQLRVFYINPTSGDVREITRLSGPAHGCTLSPTGVVFTVGKDLGANQHTLATLNPLTGQVTPIAPMRDAANANKRIVSLAFAGAQLYGFVRSDRLATINPTNGLVTPIGAASVGVGSRMGLAPRDGTSLWIIDNFSETVDTIAVGTSAVTTGPSMAQPCCTSAHGLAFVGGTLYATEYSGGNRLLSINTTTGVPTKVADLPAIVNGICATPPTF